MARTILRREDSIPLHVQISEALRRRIQNGNLGSGANFPSERELAELYGVSRMTVRQAVRHLREDGLIYYERGVGTFVSNRKIDVHTRHLGGFSDEMKSLGLTPSSRILELKREAASEPVSKELLLASDEMVIHIERLRLADNEPMAFENTYLPERLCPGLDECDLEANSLYQILVDKYAVQMHHAAESLEAAAAPQFVAKQLDIKTGSPVLVVHRVMYSEANQPLEWARTTYRADRYRATFHLSKGVR